MSYNLKVENPYKDDGTYDFIPPHRLLGAGPTNSLPSVLDALVTQPVTPCNYYFSEISDELQQLLRYVFQTKNEFTVIGQFSGNGGNEALVINLTDPGETILVAIGGVWGMKVADFGKRHKLNVVELNLPLGEVYTFDHLEEEIIKHRPVALFITHGESSGGTLQPLDGLGDICHKYDCLLVVDAVVSLAVVPLLTDEWKLDAVNSTTHKGIGAPAGMAFITLSDRAYKKMLQKKHQVPYYFDLKLLGDAWKCFGVSRRYIYTYNAQMLLAVRQALRDICKEGLENLWQRNKEVSHYFLERAEKLGITNIVKKPENRFYGVSSLKLPKDIRWPYLMEYTINKYNVEFAPGIGPTGGIHTIRIGFLGLSNSRKEIADHFIQVLEDGFQYVRSNKMDPEKCIIFKLYSLSEYGEDASDDE